MSTAEQRIYPMFALAVLALVLNAIALVRIHHLQHRVDCLERPTMSQTVTETRQPNGKITVSRPRVSYGCAR